MSGGLVGKGGAKEERGKKKKAIPFGFDDLGDGTDNTGGGLGSRELLARLDHFVEEEKREEEGGRKEGKQNDNVDSDVSKVAFPSTRDITRLAAKLSTYRPVDTCTGSPTRRRWRQQGTGSETGGLRVRARPCRNKRQIRVYVASPLPLHRHRLPTLRVGHAQISKGRRQGRERSLHIIAVHVLFTD